MQEDDCNGEFHLKIKNRRNEHGKNHNKGHVSKLKVKHGQDISSMLWSLIQKVINNLKYTFTCETKYNYSAI